VTLVPEPLKTHILITKLVIRPADFFCKLQILVLIEEPLVSKDKYSLIGPQPKITAVIVSWPNCLAHCYIWQEIIGFMGLL